MADPLTPQNQQAPPQTLQVDTPTVKPDGGVLGNAALGALQSASDAHNTSTPPQTLQVDAPQTLQVDVPADTTPHPGVIDKAWKFADDVVTNMPGIGDAHQLAGAVRDWANRKMQAPPKLDESPLAAAAKTFGLGTLRDISGLAAGATSAKGLATIGAAVVAPLPTGIYLAGTGLNDFIQGWGDIHNLDDIMNPEKLQPLLTAASQIAGGAAGVGEGFKGVSKAWENAKLGVKDAQYEAFKKLAPPSKSAPYTESDWAAAHQRILDEHMLGGTAISDPITAVSAMNEAIEKIQNEFTAKIATAPDTPLDMSQVFSQVRERLMKSPVQGFFEDGLKSLERYKNAGFERAGGAVDEPATLRTGDDLRHQMNEDNRALMKGKNNYDYANMMQTDPAFAARNIYAETLRNAIAEKLDQMGMPNARDLRGTQGSIIKMRNAMLKQVYKDVEGAVPGTGGKPGAIRKTAAAGVKAGATAAGVGVGAATGIPGGAEAGAFVGGAAGDVLSNALKGGKPVSRAELVKQAFNPQGPGRMAAVRAAGKQVIPGKAGTAPLTTAATMAATAALPPDHIHIRASDGSEHIVPSNQLGNAHVLDPGLQILRQ
jgi:hypothetical protein